LRAVAVRRAIPTADGALSEVAHRQLAVATTAQRAAVATSTAVARAAADVDAVALWEPLVLTGLAERQAWIAHARQSAVAVGGALLPCPTRVAAIPAVVVRADRRLAAVLEDSIAVGEAGFALGLAALA